MHSTWWLALFVLELLLKCCCTAVLLRVFVQGWQQLGVCRARGPAQPALASGLVLAQQLGDRGAACWVLGLQGTWLLLAHGQLPCGGGSTRGLRSWVGSPRFCEGDCESSKGIYGSASVRIHVQSVYTACGVAGLYAAVLTTVAGFQLPAGELARAAAGV